MIIIVIIIRGRPHITSAKLGGFQTLHKIKSPYCTRFTDVSAEVNLKQQQQYVLNGSADCLVGGCQTRAKES